MSEIAMNMGEGEAMGKGVSTAEMPDVPCADVRTRVMAETLADLYRRWVEEGRPDRRG